jgi:hypothetical protein
MALVAAPGCGFGSSPAKPGADAGVDGSGGGGGDDGGPTDTPPTGTGFCYGPSGWQVCLADKPSGQVPLQGALDTDKSNANNLCLKNQPDNWTATQPEACFIVGDTVTISSLNVTGSRPLVIVAQTQITVMNLLDVASHRATGAVGAGSMSAGGCKPFGGSPGIGPPGGGGAGGSFLFPGGKGGTGDGINQVGGLAADADVGAPARLRGGCAGQPGGGGKPDDGGAGGGAVYLVSAGQISILGKIDASGAGGAGEDGQHGGGGGGSGGMIVLYGSKVATMIATILIADGGGGGGGSAQSGPTIKGTDGHEPIPASPILPAFGGAGGILIGGDGGDGGNGYPALTTTIPGLLGNSGDQGAGGGGGGGGGGYIRSNQNLGAAAVSPAADAPP